MALFANPEKRIQRDLEAAQASRAQLLERRTAAETKLLEQKEIAKKLAHDGADDTALDRAEAAARASEDRIVTLSSALADREAQIATLEREQAELTDRKLRAETAAAVEKCAARLEAAGVAIDAAFAEFVTATEAAASISPDGKGLAVFAQSARAEVQPAVALVLRELRARAAATIAGTAPAALPTQPPALVPSPVVKVETFFALAHVMFADSRTGMLRRVAKYSFIDLTPEQSAHGIRLGAICARDDARINELRKQQITQQPPEAHLCADLDTGADPVRDPQLMARHSSSGSGHAVFERVDRGPPRSMTVPKGDVADKMAAGARAADDIDGR